MKEEKAPTDFLWLLLLILPPLFLGPTLSLLFFVAAMTFGGLIWGIWFNIRQSRDRRREAAKDAR